MKAETQIQFRCSKEFKRKATAYAKKHKTTVSAVTLDIWESIFRMNDKMKSK